MMEPVAFLSYAHLDNTGSSKELSLFHDLLQNELRIQTGLRVHIFFDKKSIGWGKRWASFIDRSLEGAAFLIPILTPAFFRSQSCEDEYLKFASCEREIGRNDLILPIYYVTCRELTKPNRADPLANDISSRQYRDWRHLRHKPRESTEVMLEFSELASIMAETFFELQEASELRPELKTREITKGRTAADYFEQLLDREISYDNLIAYAVQVYPNLTVSRDWTRELLKDINRDRYLTIRDIDREVKYAKSAIDSYARTRPDLFEHSTDFLTKTLLFVDSEFRQAHTASPVTLKAAELAGITRY
jgi:TIR domain-containing protein